MRTKSKILIWGTEEKARYTISVLNDYESEVEVVAIGDNNCSKHGSMFCGKKVISASQLKEYKIEGIIVASRFYEEISKQILELIHVPIYKDVWEFLSFRVSIDITGWCNAQCKWCTTGALNKKNICSKRDFMSIEKFKMIYMHLKKTGIVNRNHEILLYSWGEPLLNPDYLQIIEFLNNQDQIFSMSTNASVAIFSRLNGIYKNCRTFIFSMSGFSQDSYDKIHRFSFEKIKSNIKAIYKNIVECGFEGEAVLSFHVYKFNRHEVMSAKVFAEELGLRFVPINAYFASYSMAKDYLTGKMTNELLKESENELILDAEHIDGSFSLTERHKIMEWLKNSNKEGKCNLLTNVKCLSEGIDVPSLDVVVFLSSKNSKIDIVQSVGRVMRKADDKKYGYIVVPVVIPKGKTVEEEMNKKDGAYKIVWDVLSALKSHDDRFLSEVNKINLGASNENKNKTF